MKSFAWYDLQVIICSGILMIYYLLVLRNKRFHRYNRFYILASFFLSFLIPLVKIQLEKNDAQKGVAQIIYLLADYNASMDAAVANKGFQVNWNMVAIGAYALVSTFFLFSLVVALIRIRKLLQMHSCKNFGDVYLILTNVKGTPFSFFKYIFWNEEINLQSATGQQILQHELAHVKEKHSIDNIITQVVMIFGWFNPFFWWARRELQMIHEFIADKKAVENGDAASLAAMLLAAAYPQQQYLLTNSFFFSPIKRRLLMITNNKNPRFSYIRRVIILPLLAIVVLLFAFRAEHHLNNNSKKDFPRQIQSTTLSDTIIVRDSAGELIDKTGRMTIVNNAAGRKDTLVIISNNDSATHNNLYETIYETKSDNLYKTRSDLNNGVTSITEMPAGTQPVFFVDGKKITHDEMGKINPRDIESISVLKGENAIAKYGDEGKNGVVLIKSKLPQALYVMDGKIMNEALKNINPAEIASMNVLKDKVAIDKYGNEGKNGVIEIVTKNAFREILPSDYKDFLNRNKDVRSLNWGNGNNNITVNLNDGTSETYLLWVSESKQRAIDKYGVLPIPPPPPPPLSKPVVISIKRNPPSLLPEDEDYNKVFKVVQIPASFPGGADAWLKYLQRNLNRDVPVKNGAPEGKYKVELSFIVNEKGMLSNVKAVKDPGYGTAAEAIRMITKGPNWKPAQQNGHLVVSQTKQSITFVVSAE